MGIGGVQLERKVFRAIFFDLGNTLIYFDGSWDDTLDHAVLTMGQSLTFVGIESDPTVLAEEFKRRLLIYYEKREKDLIEHTTEFVLRDLLESIGYSDVHEDVIRTGLDTFYGTFQPHWKVESDAQETLARLRTMGYRLGLISNAGDAADVQALVDRAQLRPYFDQIFISAKIGVRKPHHRIFEIALDTFHIRPSEAVMVGDALNHDILGANNTGIASVWLTRRANKEVNDQFKARVYPDEILFNLAELPSILSNW